MWARQGWGGWDASWCPTGARAWESRGSGERGELHARAGLPEMDQPMGGGVEGCESWVRAREPLGPLRQCGMSETRPCFAVRLPPKGITVSPPTV
jgi:hypothetical protein